ncbi:MAG TPA: hypothetical protein VK826_10100, partial [Bacteroidia bacterium]|nr:hypothetical protein [Bacteroidia bacterium]
WDTQGNLINVSYHHWRNGKRSGDFVRYSKTWYPNGQLAAWENHSPFLNDTMYAQYTENGSPIQIECKYKGHIQKKTWYENGNPQTERYGVSSGIEGVTFRDSVFREWFRDGTLWKERYYDKGKSIRNNDPPNNFLAYDTRFSRGAAYVVAVTAETTTRAAWDTSFTVPLQVVDSVAVSIDNVLRYSSDTYHGAAHAIRTICVSQRANGVPDCTYTLMLTKQEYVTRDSTGRILTADIRLNQFLDSLKLTANTVNMCADRGMRKGKTINDFCITFNPTAQYLNLLYINRRLAVLAPGSVLQLSQENKTGPSSEIFYFPQGEPVGTDTTQVTIFVVEDYLFHIYGDGEVEFARLISKDQLLLEYRGEKTSAHTPKRRR